MMLETFCFFLFSVKGSVVNLKSREKGVNGSTGVLSAVCLISILFIIFAPSAWGKESKTESGKTDSNLDRTLSTFFPRM